MKTTFIYLIAIIAMTTACKTTSTTSAASNSSRFGEEAVIGGRVEDGIAKTYNRTPQNGILLGEQDASSFAQAPFNEWFDSGYDEYTPNPEMVAQIAKKMKNVQVRAYMGTWCEDSQRETPQFYKLMDAAGVNQNNITLITVDLSKTMPTELVSGYGIDRVPTFIFYRDGKEIGRYVEYARNSMEEDFLQILTTGDYKHSYQN